MKAVGRGPKLRVARRLVAGSGRRRDASAAEPVTGSADLVSATGAAFAAATHLTPADEGSKAALLALARKIDAWDRIVEWALEDADEDGGRPKVPQNDNVSISAYLKGCEQLGLTPSGRATLSQRLDRYVRSSSAAVEPSEPSESAEPAQEDESKMARVTALRRGKKQ